jgi:TP901 family phage tail tape measure protein
VAERNVAVKLSAKVDAYVAAMKRAEMSTTGFSRATQRNLKTVGGQMQTLGRGMTMAVSLPIAALGAASTKMAMDWETSFAQMVGLANVPAEEVDNLKESVLALAGETATAPQELADGLYLAASAGFDSAEALEIVEMAARSSASGMGETATVVDLLTSVLGSYGEENISAARAADILTAAVAEGKAAPEEMAQALGSVLPIAANMGITFEETAASVAFLTNAGLSTDEAVTSLRGTLLALMDPTAEARDVLKAAGTSAEELQSAIAEDGLLGALELLRAHGFDANAEALSGLIEDNRALVGATALLTDESGSLVPIMDAVADSTGKAGEAFNAVSGTDAFKMEQALTDVKVAMTELGSLLLPVAAEITEAIAGLAQWFADLPPAAQGVIAVFGGIAAVGGPLIFIVGSLIKNLTTITSTFGAAKGAMAGFAKGLGLVGIAAMVGFAAYNIFTEEQRKTESNTRKATEALDSQFNSLINTAVAAARAGQDIDAVAVANEALSRSIGEGNEQLAEAASQLNVNSTELLDVLTMMDGEGQDLTGTITHLAESFGLSALQANFYGTNFDKLTGPQAQFNEGLREQARALGITDDEFDSLTGSVQSFLDAANESDVNEIAKDFLDARAGVNAYGEELVKRAEDQLGMNRATGDAAAIYRAYTGIVAGLTDEQLAQAGVTGEVAAESAALSEAIRIATGETEGLAVAAVDGAAAMEILNGTFDIMKRNLAGGGGNTSAEQWAWIDGFGQALADVTSIQSGFVSSQDAIWESALKFGEAIDENSRSLEQNSLEGLTNRGVIADWSADIIAGVQASLDQGSSIAEVTDQFKHNRQAMIDAAVAAGFEEEEVLALVDALGLADGDWEAAVTISGYDIAMKQLEAMLLEKEDLTEADVIQINTDLETGGAWFALSEFKRRVAATHATLDVWANTAPARDAINRLNNISIGVGIYGGRFAEGGIVSGEQLVTVGESGPELILPLNNPARMASLLGMPQVASALGSMGAWMPQYGWSGGGGSSGGGSVTNTNVTVHMPPGSNGDDVVRALRKWERRRGPVPISTR